MKTAIAAFVLMCFAAIGIAHIIKPAWFLKRSGVRKGGELLNDFNELGFQIAGAIFAATALYILYKLLTAN